MIKNNKSSLVTLKTGDRFWTRSWIIKMFNASSICCPCFERTLRMMAITSSVSKGKEHLFRRARNTCKILSIRNFPSKRIRGDWFCHWTWKELRILEKSEPTPSQFLLQDWPYQKGQGDKKPISITKPTFLNSTSTKLSRFDYYSSIYNRLTDYHISHESMSISKKPINVPFQRQKTLQTLEIDPNFPTGASSRSQNWKIPDKTGEC